MMKKSQILAAIALAMALGVVAPVSSASAKVVGKDVNNADATKACEDIAEAVEAAKQAGGKYEDSAATPKPYYYDLYDALIEAVDKVEDAVETNTESARGALITAIRAAVSTATASADNQTSGNYDIPVKAERDALKAITTVGLDNKDSYGKAVEFANALIQKYSDIANKKDSDGNNLGNAAVAAAAVTALNTALLNAQNTIDGAYNATDVTAINTALTNMGIDTYDITNASGTDNVKKGKALIVKAKSLKMYESYKSLIEVVDKAETKVCDDDSGVNFSVQEANTIRNTIVTMTASINKGETVKPVETPNGTPADDSVNAPATGIAGTAEGTATTVSIVAGLATALTALGAGVVAYRSARRK